MRTSVDIVNYFKRRKQKQKYKRTLNNLLWQINDLRYELQRKKEWQIMYSDLIKQLENVSKYCALKDSKEIKVSYPLEHFATFETAVCMPSGNPILQELHAENIYYAKVIVNDYIIEDLIHFRIETAEGKYAYQYSKKGITIQPFNKIMKEVAWLLAHAWFDRIHPRKKG